MALWRSDPNSPPGLIGLETRALYPCELWWRDRSGAFSFLGLKKATLMNGQSSVTQGHICRCLDAGSRTQTSPPKTPQAGVGGSASIGMSFRSSAILIMLRRSWRRACAGRWPAGRDEAGDSIASGAPFSSSSFRSPSGESQGAGAASDGGHQTCAQHRGPLLVLGGQKYPQLLQLWS